MKIKNINSISPNTLFDYKDLILVSIVFLFKKPNEILLQLRDDNPYIMHPNTWGPLGGHCEIGESPRNCAIRECYEESGYKCNKLEWYANISLPYKKNNYHIVSIFWSIFDNLQQINCFEGQKISFIQINDLNYLNISEKNKFLINEINEKIK